MTIDAPGEMTDRPARRLTAGGASCYLNTARAPLQTTDRSQRALPCRCLPGPVSTASGHTENGSSVGCLLLMGRRQKDATRKTASPPRLYDGLRGVLGAWSGPSLTGLSV